MQLGAEHPEFFPVDVNRASQRDLLRVPGIGVNSAMRITAARRSATLRLEDLKKLGVVLKRAQYFITCGGHAASPASLAQSSLLTALLSDKSLELYRYRNALPREQLSLFDLPPVVRASGRG